MTQTTSTKINFKHYTHILQHGNPESIIVRQSGRTTSMVIDAVNSVYKGTNTDIYFINIYCAKSFVQLTQDMFKIINCHILCIKKFDCSIVIKLKAQNKEVKLVLKSASSFNQTTYKGIQNRNVFLDHTLYFKN